MNMAILNFVIDYYITLNDRLLAKNAMSLREILQKQALNDGKLFDIKRRKSRNFHIGQSLTEKFEVTKNFDTRLHCENVYEDDDDDSTMGKYTKWTSEQCGFKRTFEKIIPLECRTSIDSRSVVSLALVKRQSTILGAYANKLPIMSINVSRLLYTIEAFKFRDYNQGSQTPIQQALDFYVRTDIAHRNTNLAPNHQFSEFLHCLRTTGYLEYIFDLARTLNLNVDLIVDNIMFVRYIRVDVSSRELHSIGIGFITVLHRQNNGSKWYVKTTKEPIINDPIANTQSLIQNDPILSAINASLNKRVGYENIADAENRIKNDLNLNSATSFINSLS